MQKQKAVKCPGEGTVKTAQTPSLYHQADIIDQEQSYLLALALPSDKANGVVRNLLRNKRSLKAERFSSRLVVAVRRCMHWPAPLTL